MWRIARRLVLLAIALTGLIGAGAAAAPSGARSPSALSPYFAAPFMATRLRYGFGQDPAWANDGEVLSAQLDAAGISQIYRARSDGSHQVCLTCRTVRGPNGLPQERGQGDWILFESFGQQPVHIGGPGLGGYGGDLYVMRPDGSQVHRLTTRSDPNDETPFTQTGGTPYDNFHAYWSPDGRHIAWTHTEADPLSAGGQRWEIMVGDFTVTRGVPSLRGVRVVGPPYGAYETQPWSPDGKGFLFFASGGARSPFQSAPPGWGNGRVYYMRIYGDGASPRRPRVTPIGDNLPVYEEQAVFTPDMETVIMMSNRGAASGSWYDAVAGAAQRTGFDAPDTGSTQTLQFLADFLGPDFHSDLYAVDGPTGAVRRLTTFDRVIPEFFWNRDSTQLIWSFGGSARTPTYTGRFLGITRGERRFPAHTPRWLVGRPIDMARVGAQAQTIRDPGPTNDPPVAVAGPAYPAPAFPHAARRGDATTVPVVVGSYFTLWLQDLAQLGQAVGATFTTSAPGRVLGLA